MDQQPPSSLFEVTLVGHHLLPLPGSPPMDWWCSQSPLEPLPMDRHRSLMDLNPKIAYGVRARTSGRIIVGLVSLLSRVRRSTIEAGALAYFLRAILSSA